MSHNVNVFSDINKDRNKRSSNFSSKEVKFLITLVDKRKEIIESKKTDRISSEEKVKAWVEIEDEFNEVFDDYRSLKVLKTKYENLKKNVKRQLPKIVSNLSLVKIMQSNKTIIGNEPISDFEYTDDDEDVQKNGVSKVDTKHHSIHNNEEVINTAAEQFAFETLLLEEVQPTPKMEKTPKLQASSSETTEKRKQTIDIWDEVAHKKIKKLNLEMNILAEDWKLRKAKLELELENAKTENQLKEAKLNLEIELLKEKLGNKNSST